MELLRGGVLCNFFSSITIGREGASPHLLQKSFHNSEEREGGGGVPVGL